MHDFPTPPQLQHPCECGCGRQTKVSKKTGEPNRFLHGHYVRPAPLEGCAAGDCTSVHFASSFCQKHYSRMHRHGNLVGVAPRGSAEARFWLRVLKAEQDCWVWTGTCGDHGYGSFTDDAGTCISTHRFSYQLHNGPIPPGMVICHRCDNRPCVNPDHLFLGTQRDNVLDMMQKGRHVSHMASRTECANGHTYTAETTRIDGNGHRRCRVCSRQQDAERRARKAAQG